MSPMFEREPPFEENFPVGSRFVLMGLTYTGAITTAVGKAHRSLITIITRESYPARATYSVLGVGFKNMAERATAGDFPVVVEYIRVALPGGRDVKRLAPVMDGDRPLSPGAFRLGEDGDPIDMSAFETTAATTAPGDGGTTEDDSPGF